MRNKNILKALSLLAAVCIAAGCNGSTAVETTTMTTSAQTTTTVTTTAETTTSTEGTDSQLPELEVDYVDDNGIVYYKNPTEWTCEMIYNSLLIEGEKIDTPLTFEDFGSNYSLDEETLTYFENSKHLEAGLIYNENKFGSILLMDCTSIYDRSNKEIGFIFLRNLPKEWHENFPKITVNDIGLGSTRNSVIAAFGIPYSETYQDGILNGVLIYKSEPEQMNGTLIVYLYDNKVVSFLIMLND